MKRTTKYVGFDVHQASTVALVDRVIVCDRRGAPRQGNKGDQVDADQLSELLRRGGLRAVYHGSPHHATLKELTRAYRNLVEDATRVMLRLKALFRARGIPTRGTKVYQARQRAHWLKGAMLGEARRDPAWAVPRTIPFLGRVRVAQILATLGTPWRFRTKRHLWAYAGLAVVTHTSADYQVVGGRVVRRRHAPRTRGLNRNHNRLAKDVFKGAATAATARPGVLQDFYQRLLTQGGCGRRTLRSRLPILRRKRHPALIRVESYIAESARTNPLRLSRLRSGAQIQRQMLL